MLNFELNKRIKEVEPSIGNGKKVTLRTLKSC